MLTSIIQKKITKWFSGLMLASITLSVPGSIMNSTFREPQIAHKLRQELRITQNQPTSEVKEEANLKTLQAAQNSIDPAANPVPAQQQWEKPATSPTTVQSLPSNGRSEAEIQLLARVIHAEARGEPFQGQVAVGAVLLNRLTDKRFPKSLAKIIFKPGEFCTVRDGQIWKTPNQQALRAARLAVAGWDPTGGALYFYNPAKTTSRWIWTRPVVNRIGNHIFAA